MCVGHGWFCYYVRYLSISNLLASSYAKNNSTFVALEIPEVIKTYREGGDWFKEIVKDSAGLGLSMAGSSLAAGFAAELMLTPIGWIIILAGTLGALAFEKMGEHYSGKFLDKIREVEHAFAGL